MRNLFYIDSTIKDAFSVTNKIEENKLTEEETREWLESMDDAIAQLTDKVETIEKSVKSISACGSNSDIATLFTLEHDLEVKVANIAETVNEMKTVVDYMNTVFRVEDTVPFAIIDNKVISLPARCVKAAQFWLDENKAKPQDTKLEMLKDHFGAETFDMKEEL